MKRTFRVTRKYPHILRNRKARIQRRLAPRICSDQPQPMLRGGNLHFEVDGRAGAKPACVRSWINRRSNWASAVKNWNSNSPDAVVVSITPSSPPAHCCRS